MLPRSLTRRCVSRSAPVICARRGRLCPQRSYTLYGTARIFVVFRAAESLRPSFQATAVRRAGVETKILALNRTACPTAEIAEGSESIADRCAPDGSRGPQFVPLPASLARMSQRSARLLICAVLAGLASNPRPVNRGAAHACFGVFDFKSDQNCRFLGGLGPWRPQTSEGRAGGGRGREQVPSQPVRSRCKSTVVRSSIAGVRLFFLRERLPTECAVAGR